MTVQEAISIIKSIRKEYEKKKFGVEALDLSIQALEELEQYKSLGTVEELTNQKHNLSVAYKCIEELQQPKTDCSECSRRKFYQQGYQDGLNADKWIPIGQYPSEPSLLCFENGEMCVGHFDYDCIEWIISSGGEYETCLFEYEIEPIAWQNLPQPYKKEGAE